MKFFGARVSLFGVGMRDVVRRGLSTFCEGPVWLCENLLFTKDVYGL